MEDRAATNTSGWDPDRLAERLVNELGPSITRSLLRRFRTAIPADEMPGVIHIAAVRLLESPDADKPEPELKRLFYAYCLHVAQEIVASGSNRQRQRERSIDGEDLEKLATEASQPAGEVDRNAGGPLSRRQQLARAALGSLAERDRTILEADLLHRDGNLPAAVLAEMLGTSKKGARSARHRARQRFKEAFLRLEAAEGRGEDGQAGQAGQSQ